MVHYITTSGVGNAWVGNELRVLRAHGIPFRLHGLHSPQSTYHAAEEVAALDRETRWIYPLSRAGTLASFLLAPWIFGARFWAALWNALTGPRESENVRLRVFAHLVVACHWARGLRSEPVSLIHSQWIHSAGSVGMYGAWLLGVPFSFTGHAADLFRDRAALADKIRRAAFIICISEFHRDFYLEHGARPEQLTIAYCGIDSAHFKPLEKLRGRRRFRIVSSGRLVEKKGFKDLVSACALLAERGLDFECCIGGSGPLHGELTAQIEAAGLEERVELTGEVLKQEDLPAFMHSGDVYCLPCVRSSDNDVDGLPQMLIEAMACGLPAISTRLVGIPDLIVAGETGLLVEGHDIVGLADAIETLMHDPGLSERLARAGRNRVLEHFDLERCLDPLLDRFRSYFSPDGAEGTHRATGSTRDAG